MFGHSCAENAEAKLDAVLEEEDEDELKDEDDDDELEFDLRHFFLEGKYVLSSSEAGEKSPSSLFVWL